MNIWPTAVKTYIWFPYIFYTKNQRNFFRGTVLENHRKSLIASEASYVYILSEQNFIKNAKICQFWRVFEKWSLRSNSATRQVEKLKFKMRHFLSFYLLKQCVTRLTFNRTKLDGKCHNSYATFWVIFKQCVFGLSDIFLWILWDFSNSSVSLRNVNKNEKWKLFGSAIIQSAFRR